MKRQITCLSSVLGRDLIELGYAPHSLTSDEIKIVQPSRNSP